MEDDTFKILLERGVEFFQRRELSRFLHRPDVDKAVDAKFEDPDDDGLYEKFIQDHTKFRLRMRKRKHDEIESSDMSANIQVTGCDEAGPASANGNTNAEPVKYGDVFTLGIEDARYALSSGENVTEIFLTNPWPANQLGRKPSFLTAWLSKDLGELLSKRGRPIDY
ncbi:hypothetical protein VFPBJ_11612 [Purpureocillium lilacinum]|uniref:Uncharacterized protein n=2 Tax=Purpureocillium lilacinum TaxID=33203 RepID=A0A179F2F8_PURLI|nr:hypothetical protein VFPBJ_11612 [Purpureocillium lilacinum]